MIDSQFLPHLYSRGAFLVFGDVECAKFVVEVVVEFRHKEGELLRSGQGLLVCVLLLYVGKLLIRSTTTIKENAFLS